MGGDDLRDRARFVPSEDDETFWRLTRSFTVEQGETPSQRIEDGKAGS